MAAWSIAFSPIVKSCCIQFFCASSYAIGQTKKDRLYLQALVVQRVGAGVCLPLPEQTSHDAVRRKSPGSTTYAERRSAADGSRARFISGSCDARARARDPRRTKFNTTASARRRRRDYCVDRIRTVLVAINEDWFEVPWLIVALRTDRNSQ